MASPEPKGTIGREARTTNAKRTSLVTRTQEEKSSDTHATITIGDPKKGPEVPRQSEKQESQYVSRARTESTDIS